MQKDGKLLEKVILLGKLMVRNANGWKIGGKAFGKSFSFRNTWNVLWLLQL